MSSLEAMQERINELEAENQKLLTENYIIKAESYLHQYIIKNSPDGICAFSLTGKSTLANPTFLEMLQYTQAEMDALEGHEIVDMPPEEFQALLKEIAATNKWTGEITYRRKDGSTFPAYLATTAIFEADDTPVGLVGTVRDATKRKNIENAIRASEAKYSTVLRNLPGILVVMIDKDYRYELFDGGELRNLGLKKEDMEGKTVAEAFGDNVPPDWLPTVDKALAGDTVKLETFIGDQRYDTFTLPMYEADGQINRVLNIAINITERVAAEAERDRLQQEIIRTQKLTLQELSTPIIPLLDNVLIVPLIGSIDTSRARDIMRNLLSGISEHRAKTIIIDITGVPMVDSGVADHLNKTIQAARLKGAHTIVTGVSDAVAETIIDLGIDWRDIQVMRDLQSGLREVLKQFNRNIL